MCGQLKNMLKDGTFILTPFKTSPRKNDSNLKRKEEDENWTTPGKKRLKISVKQLNENDETLSKINNKEEIMKLLKKTENPNCHNRYSPLSHLEDNCEDMCKDDKRISKR